VHFTGLPDVIDPYSCCECREPCAQGETFSQRAQSLYTRPRMRQSNWFLRDTNA
jgi:hypothetical protein